MLLTSTPSAAERRELASAAALAGAEAVLEGSDLALFQATDSNISVTEASTATGGHS